MGYKYTETTREQVKNSWVKVEKGYGPRRRVVVQAATVGVARGLGACTGTIAGISTVTRRTIAGSIIRRVATDRTVVSVNGCVSIKIQIDTTAG